MKNIVDELNTAISVLERFSLSGKAVDMMAEAKRHIYLAQGIAKKCDDTEVKEEKSDGR